MRTSNLRRILTPSPIDPNFDSPIRGAYEIGTSLIFKPSLAQEVNISASISNAVKIPVVGIGAGSQCDAQVLVWQDMAGLRTGKLPRFVKQYADLNSVLTSAVSNYIEEVENGTFPCIEHEFN